jgi:hypothetical protein
MAYAGTGSAQDSGLLFLVTILFFASILLVIFIIEQIKKVFRRLLHPGEPDLDSDLQISDIDGL